jgi:hypothetical protein
MSSLPARRGWQRSTLSSSGPQRARSAQAAGPLIALFALSFLATGCENEQPPHIARDLSHLEIAAYDKPILFDGGAEGERLKLSGWAPTEPPFVWSDGIAATLVARLPSTEEPVQIQFRMCGMNVPKRVPFQRVDLYVNSEKVARWTVLDDNVFTATVPAKFVSQPDPLLIIDLYTPNAASPDSLGVGGDRRRLGVRLSEVRFLKGAKQAAGGFSQLPDRSRTPPVLLAHHMPHSFSW